MCERCELCEFKFLIKNCLCIHDTLHTLHARHFIDHLRVEHGRRLGFEPWRGGRRVDLSRGALPPNWSLGEALHVVNSLTEVDNVEEASTNFVRPCWELGGWIRNHGGIRLHHGGFRSIHPGRLDSTTAVFEGKGREVPKVNFYMHGWAVDRFEKGTDSALRFMDVECVKGFQFLRATACHQLDAQRVRGVLGGCDTGCGARCFDQVRKIVACDGLSSQGVPAAHVEKASKGGFERVLRGF